jgi:hypothetical protein
MLFARRQNAATARLSIAASSRSYAAWTLALAAMASGCGAAAKPVAPTFDRTGGPYETVCSKAMADHAQELAGKKYIPVELLVHDWPQDVTPTAPTEKLQSFLPESDYVAKLTALSGRRIRTTLVMARGGTGKSKLAESLTAQTCKSTPIFRIDLNTDIAARLDTVPAGQNAIAAAIASQLQLDTAAGAEAALRAALGDRPFVAMLDSLDEVPLLQRQAVVTSIDDLIVRVAPQARAIVMTRPPVFTSNYGLQTVDARLEIPQLTCDETEGAIGRLPSTPTETTDFQVFVKRYGIDRKVAAFDRCYYPHMATYRDLQVVQRLALNSAVDKDTPDFKGFQSSRAQVYTYFATAQMLKDMQGVPTTPRQALAIIDRMVDAKKPQNGARNLPFTVQECVAVAGTEASDAKPDIGARQAVCERLLQSALFRAGTPGVWHFDNQSIGDLFLARWTVAQIDAAAAGKDGQPCDVVSKLADLLESNEVAGFLVGHPSGQKCFAQVAMELTRRSGCAQNVAEMLDQGLPSGPDRKSILSAADKELARLQPSVCVTGLMESLGRGLAEPPAAPPVPVKTVPAAKAKTATPAKKGK